MPESKLPIVHEFCFPSLLTSELVLLLPHHCVHAGASYVFPVPSAHRHIADTVCPVEGKHMRNHAAFCHPPSDSVKIIINILVSQPHRGEGAFFFSWVALIIVYLYVHI